MIRNNLRCIFQRQNNLLDRYNSVLYFSNEILPQQATDISQTKAWFSLNFFFLCDLNLHTYSQGVCTGRAFTLTGVMLPASAAQMQHICQVARADSTGHTVFLNGGHVLHTHTFDKK